MLTGGTELIIAFSAARGLFQSTLVTSTCFSPLLLLQDGGLDLGGAELEGGRGQRDPTHFHAHSLSQVIEEPEI